MGWTWKYSLRFMNNEGQWQEQDIFKNPEEALRAKESYQANGMRQMQVLDLETDTIIG